MGLEYRKRVRTSKNSTMNVSGSGVSMTYRLGPFTMNSRGHVHLRLGKGLMFRIF